MINRAHRRDYLRQILHAAGKPLTTAKVHAKLVAWVRRHGDDDDEQHEKATIRDLKVLEDLDYVRSTINEADKRSFALVCGGARSHSLVLSPSDAMSLSAIFKHAERFGLQAAA